MLNNQTLSQEQMWVTQTNMISLEPVPSQTPRGEDLEMASSMTWKSMGVPFRQRSRHHGETPEFRVVIQFLGSKFQIPLDSLVKCVLVKKTLHSKNVRDPLVMKYGNESSIHTDHTVHISYRFL